MPGLDRRIQPFRPDLAAEHLRGRVDAARFVAGEKRSIIRGFAALRREPSDSAALDTELLFGETVRVYDERNGWAWLQNETDGYVGYVESDAIGPHRPAPTHRLRALRSYVYPEPDLKTPPRDLLSLGAQVETVEQSNAFSRLAGGGWMYSRHLSPLDAFECDPVAVALRFLGTPYLWGGRTSVGLDCSALLQLSLASCGQAVPRDSDLQSREIGDAVPYAGDENVLQRGDLIFWPGHCGIWIDRDRFLHANATDMMVALAPLATVSVHIETIEGTQISTVRRTQILGNTR